MNIHKYLYNRLSPSHQSFRQWREHATQRISEIIIDPQAPNPSFYDRFCPLRHILVVPTVLIYKAFLLLFDNMSPCSWLYWRCNISLSMWRGGNRIFTNYTYIIHFFTKLPKLPPKKLWWVSFFELCAHMNKIFLKVHFVYVFVTRPKNECFQEHRLASQNF